MLRARLTSSVRSAPDGGIGYGMLRYANAQTAPLLARPRAPQVLFNYYGRFAGRPGARLDAGAGVRRARRRSPTASSACPTR